MSYIMYMAYECIYYIMYMAYECIYCILYLYDPYRPVRACMHVCLTPHTWVRCRGHRGCNGDDDELFNYFFIPFCF